MAEMAEVTEVAEVGTDSVRSRDGNGRRRRIISAALVISGIAVASAIPASSSISATSATSATSSLQAPSQWPQFRNTSTLSGVSASPLPATLRLQWTFDATDGRLLSLSMEQETEGRSIVPQGEIHIRQLTRVELTPLS